MISRIHEKLGTAGFVIAIVALIAALGGTALAAVGLNSKQKKEVTKIAKKYAGKNGENGADGATGPQGPQGPKGDTGAQGNPGAPGEDGEDGEDGLNGEDGVCSVSVPECVLPPGATMSGVYLAQQEGEGGRILVPISFPLRVEANLEYHFIGVGEPATADCPTPEGQRLTGEPAAAPGQICFYSEGLVNATDAGFLQNGQSGLIREFQAGDETARSTVRGWWAVTAP